MASLPYDLISEILSYLPGKTLIRFRTVSKRFNSLISDPFFLRLHSRRSRVHPFALNAVSTLHGSSSFDLRIFLSDENNETLHESTRRLDKDRVKRIIGSNHQLLCFILDSSISLYDPMNRDFLELPSSRVRSPQKISFGFVDSTMQYKVIGWRFPCCLNLEFEVLTISVIRGCRLEISPWRSSKISCPYLLHHSYPPIQVEGYVYWRTYDSRIVSFSLQDESFSAVLEHPRFPGKDRSLTEVENPSDFMLYAIRGKLWLAEYDDHKLVVEIWTRSDEKGSDWIEIHRVNVQGTLGFSQYHLNYTYFPFEMLDISRDFALFRLLHPNVIKYYDPREQITQDTEELIGELYLCHYFDGLLSLKNISCC